MRKTTKTLTYDKLENRQLMAADIGFAHGELTIDMSESGRNDLDVGSIEYLQLIRGRFKTLKSRGSLRRSNAFRST